MTIYQDQHIIDSSLISFGHNPHNPVQTRVIFCHGMTMQGADFAAPMQACADKGLYAITFDFPGHGSPQHWGGDYSHERNVAMLRQVITQTGSSPFVLVGASMGGVVAQEYLYMHDYPPAAALALIDVGPFVPTDIMKGVAYNLNKNLAASTQQAAANNINSLFKGMDFEDDNARQNYLKQKLFLDNATGLYTPNWDPATRNKLLPKIALEGHDLTDNWHAWAEKQRPTFVLHGQDSRVLKDDLLNSMQQIFTDVGNAGLLEIEHRPNAGHLPLLNTPQQQQKFLKWIDNVQTSLMAQKISAPDYCYAT